MKTIVVLSLLVVISCGHEQKKGTWDRGKIPFELVGLNIEEVSAVMQAMTAWEVVSMNRIKFIYLPFAGDDLDNVSDVKPLIIMKGGLDIGEGLCVGQGYNQELQSLIILKTFTQTNICHELGHVLGLIHEQQRPDRELYITVDMSKVEPDLRLQFLPTEPRSYTYWQYPYDYESIMHYKHIAIDSHGHVVGNTRPSLIDAIKVQDIYEPQDPIELQCGPWTIKINR